MEAFEDSPSFDRHFGNDESVAPRLPHTQSPRDASTGRKSNRDVRGGTNPARRFWTRLAVALRPRSNSCVIVSPFISQADQSVSSPFGGIPAPQHHAPATSPAFRLGWAREASPYMWRNQGARRVDRLLGTLTERGRAHAYEQPVSPPCTTTGKHRRRFRRGRPNNPKICGLMESM